MITKPSPLRHSVVVPTRGRKARRPRALRAQVLLPVLILAIMVLPGLATGAPCVPGTLGCPAPPPVLVVPDCYTAPGLALPPAPLIPVRALQDAVVHADDAGQLLAGAGSVSSTGEYQYRIPIEVPAGRAGMQPSLALAYGSRGRNGLVAVAGNYGEEGTEYRTEDDTFARIRSHATSNLGVTSFSVEMRDGRLRTYARPQEPNAAVSWVVAWPIQEEHDRSGNSVLYGYTQSSSVNSIEYYPSRIDYNTITNNKGTVPGPRNVQFQYDTRSDSAYAYVGPRRVGTYHRLKSILLSAPNPVTSEPVWRYDLSYEPGPGSAASRLTSVQRCGAQHDGTKGGCFVPKRFTWNQDVQGSTYTEEKFDAAESSDAVFLVGDFGGAGLSSILKSDGTQLRSTIDPAHPLSSHVECTGLLPATDMLNAKLVDLYGDGRTRILAPTTVGSLDYYFVIDVDRVQSSNPNDPPTCELNYKSVIVGETGQPGASCIHVTDLNGDGLPDLIRGDEFSNPNFWDWHYRLNAPPANPQAAWVFGPKLVAPTTDPPVLSDNPNTIEYRSFSRDDGNHRGVIFPATNTTGSLNGFGLSATGATFAAYTGAKPGYVSWDTVTDTSRAGYADTDGLVTAVTTSAYGQPLRTVHMAYEPTERVYASETWNDLGQASFLLFDPARGFTLASEDANGLTAHFQYDDVGRTVHSDTTGQAAVDLHYKPRTAPGGAVIGTTVYSVSATGAKSRTDQDARGRAVGSAHVGFNGTWIEQATAYDLFGRVAQVTRPDFGAPSALVTKYTYDNLDRPLTRVVPGGGAVTFVHDFFTTEKLDSFTDRLTVRDLDDRVVQSVEDASGAHLSTVFTYLVFNRVDHVADPSGNVIHIDYDQRGRRTGVQDPDTGTTTFTYDGFGDVVSSTASGSLTSYTYDTLGRPLQTNHGSEWTTNTWDTHGAGRLAHTVSPDGVEQDFAYNSLGQAEKLTYTVDGHDFSFGTTYDQLGRITNLTYPTAPGMAKPFSVGKSYNSWGYLAAVYNPDDYFNVYFRVDARTPEGQLAQATLGDTTTATRKYDSTTGLLSDASDGAAVSLGYGYYPDGSLKSLDDSVGGRAERFGYDQLHRLATWSSVAGQPEVDYHYDVLGNLTEVWTRPQPFPWSPASLKEHNTYGTNGKPHALTGGPLGTYHYDARGRQDWSPTRSLVVYNERDLPKSLAVPGWFTSTFAYDATGARVKKENASETVVTLAGLYERHKKGNTTSHVFNVAGGEEGSSAQVVYTEALAPAPASTTVRYLHHDPRLGSVAAVTDKSGKLKESFYYDPFGRPTDELNAPLGNGPVDVPTGFTGHDHDDELGLINMRGRMYDPTIRRFLSADPHVTDPSLGQSYNRYSYVLNNPTNLVDPTGFDWWDFGSGGWYSSDGGCIGQECSGSGVFTSSEVDFGFGGFSHSNYASAPAGGSSGSAVTNGGYGSPVTAYEVDRLTSVPSGPGAPGGTVSGPLAQAWLKPSATDFKDQFKSNLDDLIAYNNKLIDGREPPPKPEFPGMSGVGEKTGAPGRMMAEFFAVNAVGALAADSVGGAYRFFRGTVALEGVVDGADAGSTILRAVGGAEDVREATIVREILSTEKVKDVLGEVETLTRTSKLEHGVASLADGSRVLVSGGADGIDVGSLSIRRAQLHSHIPGSFAGASTEDRLLIDYYFQRSSWVMEVSEAGATTTRFRVFPVEE